MVEAPRTLARVAEELEQVVLSASACVARLADVQRNMAPLVAHPGVAQLVRDIDAAAAVLDRFDLAGAAAAQGGDPQHQAATDRFDAAFDDTLAGMHTMRREAARAVVVASARGHALGPHIVQLRRELGALEQQAQDAGRLLQRLGDPGRTIPSGSVWRAVTLLAQRANDLRELEAAGREVLEALRDSEEAFAALIVRLKRELAPTYVEWKRLLAPVAMRTFAAQPQPFSLAEAREAHMLLQRQVQVARESAAAFTALQARLEAAVLKLGERTRRAAGT